MSISFTHHNCLSRGSHTCLHWWKGRADYIQEFPVFTQELSLSHKTSLDLVTVDRLQEHTRVVPPSEDHDLVYDTHCPRIPQRCPSLRGMRPCLNPLRIEDVKKTTSSHLFTLQLSLLPTDTPRRTLTRMPLQHNQAYLHWPYSSPSFITTP